MKLHALEKLLDSQLPENIEDHPRLVPEILEYLGLGESHQYLDASVFDTIIESQNLQGIKGPFQEYLQNLAVKFSQLWLQKPYQGLKFWYKIHLDGGGISMIGPMISYLRQKFPGKKFFKMLDWCAGPGFMGIIAQYEGLAEYVALLDISKEAAECAEKTIEDNGLQKIRFYQSDNFALLGPGEKFDIVIGNPPWTYGPSNIFNPLLSEDLGWELHRSFYQQIRNYLYPGGIVCLTCYEPYHKEAWLPNDKGGAFDIRPDLPVIAFEEMIREGGLKFIEIAQPPSLDKAHMGKGLHLVLSQFQE